MNFNFRHFSSLLSANALWRVRHFINWMSYVLDKIGWKECYEDKINFT
jgi:hypothetical protein